MPVKLSVSLSDSYGKSVCNKESVIELIGAKTTVSSIKEVEEDGEN